MRKRAIVTGIGVIAPNGIGKNEFWENLLVGKSGIKEIISFDTTTCETKIRVPASKLGGQWHFNKKRLDKWLLDHENTRMK